MLEQHIYKEAGPGYNPVALKQKYSEEREKRLRDDGNTQFRLVKERVLQHFVKDPNAEDDYSRQAIDESVSVLIIGGGYGGQLITARLIEAGITNISIVDKAGDFGGTWYWNRYPGAACDVESYVYMPLLEETGYMPTEKYAKGPELLEHAQRIGRHYGLYSKAHFQTEVLSLKWDANNHTWIASTNRDDDIRARFVVTASGPLHAPKLPGVPGIEKFKGHSFHTTRWDYNYTGGNQAGGLNKLADKRVGIIGTGATSVQVVPHLGLASQHLYVFQRTPSSVDARKNKPTDPLWASTLLPGWHQQRMDNFNCIISGIHQDEDLVNDGWTDVASKFAVSVLGRGKEQTDAAKQNAEKIQRADFYKMEQIRARVDEVVKDPETARQLKPWYNQFCKRPCFHDDYLETFNRSNTTLVDTDGKGIERITEKGVVANGREYELDCIVYATGFDFNTDYSQRMGVDIRGRGNVALCDKWKDGPRTLYGMHTRDFPNCFIISQSQSGVSPNFTHMLNEQAKHIAYVVSTCYTRKIRTIEPSVVAEDQWVATIMELSGLRGDFLKDCTPGYYNDEGKISDRSLQSSSYGLGAVDFIKILLDWRQSDTLDGLETDYEESAKNVSEIEH